METSNDGGGGGRGGGAEREARQQLAELDKAVSSTRAAGYPLSPRWHLFALATIAPAVVAFESQAGLVRVGVVLGAVVLLVIVGVHDWRRRQVRPIRAPRSPAQLGAAFAFVLVLCLTLISLGPLASRWPPGIVAVVSYGWFLAAFWLLGRRLERAMSVGAPGGSSVA